MPRLPGGLSPLIAGTTTGYTLLMPYDLQALLNQTAINELQKLGLAGAGTIVTLSMISGMAVSSVLELTDGSDPLARSPQNCTCASQRQAQMHLRDIDGNVCFFPIGEPHDASEHLACLVPTH